MANYKDGRGHPLTDGDEVIVILDEGETVEKGRVTLFTKEDEYEEALERGILLVTDENGHVNERLAEDCLLVVEDESETA